MILVRIHLMKMCSPTFPVATRTLPYNLLNSILIRDVLQTPSLPDVTLSTWAMYYVHFSEYGKFINSADL